MHISQKLTSFALMPRIFLPLLCVCAVVHVDITKCSSQGFSPLLSDLQNYESFGSQSQLQASTNSRYIDESAVSLNSESTIHLPRPPQGKAKSGLRSSSSRTLYRQRQHQSGRFAEQFEKPNIPTNKHHQYSRKSIPQAEQMSTDKKESSVKLPFLDHDEPVMLNLFQGPKPSKPSADKTRHRSNTRIFDSDFRQNARRQSFGHELQLQRRHTVSVNLGGISRNSISVSSTDIYDPEQSSVQLDTITIGRILKPYGQIGGRVTNDIYKKIQPTQKTIHSLTKREYEIKLIVLERIRSEIVDYHQRVHHSTQQVEMIKDYLKIANNIDGLVSYQNIFAKSKSKDVTIGMQFANYYLFFQAFKK